MKKAMELHLRFFPYSDLVWQVGLMPAYEHQMRMRGLGPYTFRKPRQELDAETVKYFEAELPKRLSAFKELID